MVKKVEASLANIGGYCPKDILKNAREKNHSEKELFRDYLETVLENLDREILIDIKDEGIKKFGNAVQFFVEKVIGCFEKLCGLKFTVTPAGSFPLGLKIEEIDEFDFVLNWSNMPKQVHELSRNEIEFFFKENFKNTTGIALQVILSKCKNTGKVSIERLTCQEAAINLILSWLCPGGCRHYISMDLAVSQKSKEFWEKRTDWLKGTPFEEVIKDEKEKYKPVYKHFTFLPYLGKKVWNKLDYRSADPNANPTKQTAFSAFNIDTNYLDQAIFDMFDKLMPTNKTVLRVLKFIFKHIFPKLCKHQYCALHEKVIRDYKPFMTSYHSKQLLYQKVKEDRDWKSKDISSQIISILGSIHTQLLDDALLPSYTPQLPKGSLKNYPFYFMEDWKNGLISWFENGCPGTSDNIIILEEENDRYAEIYFFSDLFITTANEPTTFRDRYLPRILNNKDKSYDLLKLDLPKTIFDMKVRGKVIYGIYHYIRREVTHKINHLDLRPCNELYFFHFFKLRCERLLAIGDTEFESERIIGEIKSLEHRFRPFGVKPDKIIDVQKILSRCLCEINYDWCLEKLMIIVRQMTLAEVMETYKFFADKFKTLRSERKLKESNDIGTQSISKTYKDNPQRLTEVLEVFGNKCCSSCRACIWLYVAITFVIKFE